MLSNCDLLVCYGRMVRSQQVLGNRTPDSRLAMLESK